MNIIRINTVPEFQIVSRENLNVSNEFKVEITNEFNHASQTINAAISSLENENYTLLLESFPEGNAGDKFSYSITNSLTNVLVSLGKFLIVLENENIQDYSKKSINKFYI